MKYNIYLIAILLTVLAGCTDNIEEDSIINPSANSSVIDGVFLFEQGAISMTGSLDISLNIYKEHDIEPYVYFPFYKLQGEQNDEWYSIPSVNINENYKIYIEKKMSSSKDEILQINLKAYEIDENIGISQLNMEQLNILAVKASSYRTLIENNINTRDYNNLIQYSGL